MVDKANEDKVAEEMDKVRKVLINSAGQGTTGRYMAMTEELHEGKSHQKSDTKRMGKVLGRSKRSGN